MSIDQFARYRHAIATGTRIEWERGDVASGFYRQNTGRGASKPIEAVAIFRNEDGKLECIRDVYGDGSRMDAAQIEELFASCCVYPVPEDVYRAVTERGEDWPAEYGTRLSMKDQAAGVAWTPAYGRKKLGMAENERAVVGDNRPPEPTPEEEPTGHKIDGEQTPDRVAFAEISDLSAEVKRWLRSIGGAATTKEHADTLADYATKFAALGKKADAARDAEKRPHLEAGRDVDARWKPPITNAENAKKRCKELAQAWREAENARRADEERKANEARAAEAARNGSDTPEPVKIDRVGGVGNIRTVSERETVSWVVVDYRKYIEHLTGGDGELAAELIEALDKIARRRAEPAPGVERKTERRAA